MLWHQCPCMANLVLKPRIAKLRKVWPADFFCSLQVPPTTLRKDSGSSAKKLFHTSTHNWSDITNTTWTITQQFIEERAHVPSSVLMIVLHLVYMFGSSHKFQWDICFVRTSCSSLILIPCYDRSNQGQQLYSNLTVTHPCGSPVNDSLYSHCNKVR